LNSTNMKYLLTVNKHLLKIKNYTILKLNKYMFTYIYIYIDLVNISLVLFKQIFNKIQ